MLLLKHFEANDQILLRVVADALHQLLGLIQGLIGVVVDGAVLGQIARASLAFVHALQNGIERVTVSSSFCANAGSLAILPRRHCPR